MGFFFDRQSVAGKGFAATAPLPYIGPPFLLKPTRALDTETVMHN
jgi:hypothetical protein